MDLPITDNRLGSKKECWLCHKEPDGLVTFEDHHIVPRHLGGTNGPLVYLCADCHTNVHKCSDNLLKGRSFLPYRELAEKKRCLALAQVIVKASLAINSNNTNKSFVYSTVFPYSTHQKILFLKEYLSGSNHKFTQDKIVRFAIDELYKRFKG